MRSLIISNAASGASQRDEVDEVVRVFGEHGDVTHLEPPSLDTFDEDVRRAARGKDLVVVAGGDGTVNCALNALEEEISGLSLAVLPMGTGNDFARTLGLPQDPLAAARAVASGDDAAFDYGRATGGATRRLFLNACMGGFPVAVNKAIDEDTKKRLGAIAFWVGGAKAVVDLPSFNVKLDGLELPECVAVGVGNGRTAGGGIAVFPDASPQDARLDCCAMQVSGLRDGVELATKVRSGDHVPLDNVHIVKGTRIEISSDPDLEFNVDGDLVGLKTPATFEIAGTLNIRVPK